MQLLLDRNIFSQDARLEDTESSFRFVKFYLQFSDVKSWNQ